MTPISYLPRVNLNGTSKEELLKQCTDALAAVSDAFRAVQDMAPHGRDYQLNPDDYGPARHRHNRWLERLDDMAKAIEEIGFQISVQE